MCVRPLPCSLDPICALHSVQCLAVNPHSNQWKCMISQGTHRAPHSHWFKWIWNAKQFGLFPRSIHCLLLPISHSRDRQVSTYWDAPTGAETRTMGKCATNWLCSITVPFDSIGSQRGRQLVSCFSSLPHFTSVWKTWWLVWSRPRINGSSPTQIDPTPNGNQ